jgi:hypothetical protein
MSSITRRDFLNGAALTIAAGLTPAAQIAAQPSRYPPALMGLRGQHEGSFEAAHALAREGRRLPIERTPIEETYDLVVVGGGISGLAAAWFYRRARPPARILVLDNHDDFGGHAKRNEFTLDGRGIIGYGGSQSLQSPNWLYILERDARDPREVFTRDLDLPRGPDRERVWFREHSVLLRGSESQALATTGAFRVVHADDLRDSRGHSFDPRSGELRHLREQKLVRTIPIRDGRALVVLTERGRDVLERNRHEREQHFYSGLQRPRKLLHDAKVYQAYEREAERLREDGAVIHRVMLDTELKREYQLFLQEHNRGKSDSDGRPNRSPDEIARWTMDHDLPEKDGHVRGVNYFCHVRQI